jgi:hypothetical protein
MPYVNRDSNGNITGVFAVAQAPRQEWIDPTLIPTPAQTSAQARQRGESYVSRFFSDMQLMKLMLLLSNPSTPPTQLSMVQAVYSWLTTIETAWLNPVNIPTFDPATFGAPPYAYEVIITTTT